MGENNLYIHNVDLVDPVDLDPQFYFSVFLLQKLSPPEANLCTFTLYYANLRKITSIYVITVMPKSNFRSKFLKFS